MTKAAPVWSRNGLPPLIARRSCDLNSRLGRSEIPGRNDPNHFLPVSAVPANGRPMQELDPQQSAARAWFEALRTRICAEFEAIEREAGSDAAFEYIPWDRPDPSGAPGGGGVRGQMTGKVFEKVGVNVSTVGGTFAPEFAKTIPGAEEGGNRFFATGISLVAHMTNPHVPAVHMNTRFLVTTKRWFGGGADLNPPIPYAEDTADFHTALKRACDDHAPVGDYPRFAQWAEAYFHIPHRNVARGVGGFFYDHLDNNNLLIPDDYTGYTCHHIDFAMNQTLFDPHPIQNRCK